MIYGKVYHSTEHILHPIIFQISELTKNHLPSNSYMKLFHSECFSISINPGNTSTTYHSGWTEWELIAFYPEV